VTSTFRRNRIGLAGIFAAALSLLVLAAPAAAKVEYGFAPQTSVGGADYQKMDTVNTDVVKIQVGWNTIQSSPGDCTSIGGACDWSAADGLIGAAAANGGIRSVVGLFGTASFAENDPFKPPLKDLDGWKDFTDAFVKRYGPGGDYWSGIYQAQFGLTAPVVPVTTVQVWNEQSSFQFFKPKPNVKKYAKLLVASSEAIRKANKKVDVVLGGMFPDTGPKGIPLEKFLKDLYKAKGVKSKTFDAVAVHPYAENGKQLKKQIGGARKTMNKSGGKKDDIWITEIGYASDGPKKQEVVKKGEKGQAKAIKAAYKVIKKNDKKWDVKGVIYFTWQDSNAADICKFCAFSGLLDVNGNEKKAFNVYKKATK
jgi:hypothetical protein